MNYFIRYFTLFFIISISVPVMASFSANYNCPEASEVKKAILMAIHHNNSKINIPTHFGLLQGDLSFIDVNHLQNFSFDHATFLFGNTKIPSYEVACAYHSPNIILYTYSDYGKSTLYIGASPNWIPDSEQLYATCTYSAKYCVFMKKPDSKS